MTPSLFISYSHADMAPIDWLAKLKLYLAPLRRGELVEVWDDTALRVGEDWRLQIDEAMDRASAAVLLVGPGFLASEFISRQELPALLSAARNHGVKIYPLIVGHCAYRLSDLEPYQAFNEPDDPLESLLPADQNKILNRLSMDVDEALRHAKVVDPGRKPRDLKAPVRAIGQYLQDTRIAFIAQARRRNDLVNAITKRLKFNNDLEFEKFFYRYYQQMSAEERFQFDQIRAMTEGPLYTGNRGILEIINQNPELLDEISGLTALRQHLVFWLNKYDKVFLNTPKMCLLYTGVEDGVPFPVGLDAEIARFLRGK